MTPATLSAQEFERMKLGLYQMQESARKGELELLYFDESGFSCLPNVQRSWSPLDIDPEITDRWLLQHRFVTLFLPPYSPELNLIEILWKHAKFHWRGFTSWTKDTLIPEVTNLLSSFGSKFHINYA